MTGPPTKANAQPHVVKAARSSLPTKRASTNVAPPPELRKTWEAVLKREGLGEHAADGHKVTPGIGERWRSWKAFCEQEFRERFGREWSTVAWPTRKSIRVQLESSRWMVIADKKTGKPRRVPSRFALRTWRRALIFVLDTYGMRFRERVQRRRRVWVEQRADGTTRQLPTITESTTWADVTVDGPVELVETDEIVDASTEVHLPTMPIGTRIERSEFPRRGQKRSVRTFEIQMMPAAHMLTARDMSVIASLLGFVKFQGKPERYGQRLERETAAFERSLRAHGRNAVVRGPATEKPGVGARAKYPRK